MDQQEIINEIERRAWEARVSISCLCQRAGLHPTTFSRWKRSADNPIPMAATTASLKKLFDALDQIAAENRRRRGRKAKAVAA
jgi:hypothetical protein